ncbi:MAG: hypothetical protein K5637_01870 [Lachnospiraceae bacterium]|nr:hypothetical protein [Lachnospiraceae bacterium]
MVELLSLDDAVIVVRQLIDNEVDDVKLIRKELMQKCWIPPRPSQAAEELSGLICDINPAEICAQIEGDNLRGWCKNMIMLMSMAMIQLPCWAEERDGAGR